jgi:hypothetical protein
MGNMNITGLRPKALPFLVIAICIILAAACNMPLTSKKTATPASSPIAATPSATTTSTSATGIPPAVLTEVAATLYAPFQATWTQQAAINAGPPAITTPTRTPTEGAGALPTSEGPIQPTIESVITLPPEATQEEYPFPATLAPGATQEELLVPVTLAPEATQGEYTIPTAAVTWAPGFEPPYATAIPTIPPVYNPPAPPMNIQIYPGQGFKVLGVNLPSCDGIYSANFYIYNLGAVPLESLLIKFTDLSTSSVLLGPVASDAPFIFSDRECMSGGIERLEPGQALFLGNTLSLPQLNGHTIQADISLCTGQGLGGQCYLKTVSFVIP